MQHVRVVGWVEARRRRGLHNVIVQFGRPVAGVDQQLTQYSSVPGTLRAHGGSGQQFYSDKG